MMWGRLYIFVGHAQGGPNPAFSIGMEAINYTECAIQKRNGLRDGGVFGEVQ
jgi:hypothetical protein